MNKTLCDSPNSSQHTQLPQHLPSLVAYPYRVVDVPVCTMETSCKDSAFEEIKGLEDFMKEVKLEAGLWRTGGKWSGRRKCVCGLRCETET